jgi:polyisoprenoid-binding protein YceI
MKRYFLLFLFIVFVSAIQAQLTPADNGSKVHFVIKNFGISTGGDFTGLSGKISFDPANLSTASFNVSVDANTVNTDIDSRDSHLRREEYFDVAHFPRISFVSTRVTKTNNSGFLYVFGKLTIKGVTKEVKFPFKAVAQNGGYLFEGNFSINRRDFGVGGKSLSMGDNLDVYLSVFAK